MRTTSLAWLHYQTASLLTVHVPRRVARPARSQPRRRMAVIGRQVTSSSGLVGAPRGSSLEGVTQK